MAGRTVDDGVGEGAQKFRPAVATRGKLEQLRSVIDEARIDVTLLETRWDTTFSRKRMLVFTPRIRNSRSERKSFAVVAPKSGAKAVSFTMRLS